ncbi:hypothetical protein [Novosphingobium sp. B 225]|uniref:hypothetical protein n=1 Tax=Novosphingobium sp. B 225 TaxID=1961849 RepID=UPI000B4B874C|nr:hypothetical protein [Novosphingobium sp. B 225]
MPLHLVTPFDRAPETPGELDAKPSPKRRIFADLCYILVKAGAFLGSIYLAVLGLPLAYFLLLVGGNPALLFTQLGNLSAHYLAADHAAQARFVQAAAYGLLGVATLVVIWRLPRFASQVAETLADRRKEL